MRGGKNPLVVLVRSRTAFAFGDVVPIPIIPEAEQKMLVADPAISSIAPELNTSSKLGFELWVLPKRWIDDGVTASNGVSEKDNNVRPAVLVFEIFPKTDPAPVVELP